MAKPAHDPIVASTQQPAAAPVLVTPRLDLSRARDTERPNPRHPRRKRKVFGRYEHRRRPVAAPKPFTGYGAYRLVMKVGVAHIIGPAGRICDELTVWARDALRPPATQGKVAGARHGPIQHDPFVQSRRIVAAMDKIRMLLDAINWVHTSRPEVLADMLEVQTAKAREAIIFWLKLNGCVLNKGRGRNGGTIVTPGSVDDQWRISFTISSLRGLFDFWHDNRIREGHNPLQMDASRSRLGANEKRKMKKSATRWWLDIDSLFRIKHVERQAPRPGDPLIALKVLERCRGMGLPEDALLRFEGMYRTGARMGQLGAATAYGLLVAAKDENHLALPQKGSNGLLDWQARTPPQWRAAVLKMLGKRVGGGVATLLKWAKSKCKLAHARLRQLYIFSPDGIAPRPRWKLDHWLRLAVESLSLQFEILRDDGSTVTRWFTSHWFRHVFVNRMLDRIAESTLGEAGRDGARTRLASYMGWKNQEAMLAYYGRHHFEQEVNQLVSQHQDDLNDEVSQAFSDDLDADNDNTMWPAGQVVGGDLLD